MDNNTTTNRQYKFYCMYFDQKIDDCWNEEIKYALTFFRLKPFSESGHHIEAKILVDKYDLISIAKVVMHFTNQEICSSEKVFKKYFSSSFYDENCTEFASKELNGTFRIKAEKRVNSVVACVKANLYKVTFLYFDAFHKRESFIFDFRESDFIALGRIACEILDESSFHVFTEI